MFPPLLVAAILARIPHTTTAYPSFLIGDPHKTYGKHEGSMSTHPFASGKHVSSADQHSSFRKKCWTELWHVDSPHSNTPYSKVAEADSAAPKELDPGTTNGLESCNDHHLKVEANTKQNISKDIFSGSGSVAVTEGWSRCETKSLTAKFNRDDEACHAIWASKSVKKNHGYIRRRCNFGEGGGTVWSKDWEIAEKADDWKLPCDGRCNGTAYP
jgi:hypothetical protein